MGIIDAGQGVDNPEDETALEIDTMRVTPDQGEMSGCEIASHKKPGASFHESARKIETPADGVNVRGMAEERTLLQQAPARVGQTMEDHPQQAVSSTSSRRLGIGFGSLDYVTRDTRAWSRVMPSPRRHKDGHGGTCRR